MTPGRRARTAGALDRAGLGALLRRLPLWRGVVVLGYHRIGDPAESAGDRTVFSATADDFDRELDVIKRAFEVVRLEDLGAALARRTGRAALLTFDDGYRDQATLAAPLLNAHGLPGVFFVTSGFIGERRLAWWDELAWMARNAARPVLPADGRWLPVPIALGAGDRGQAARALHARYRLLPAGLTEQFLDHVAEATGSGRAPLALAQWMTWDDVRRLRDQGHAIGGHSVSHPVLANLDRDGQRAEIDGCLEHIRAELGRPVDSFAYPSGHAGSFDQTTRALLQELGVRWAFSFRGGWIAPGTADPYDLRRVGIFADHPPALVAARVSVPQLLARESP